MENALLKLLDLFAWAFKSMKIDYAQLRAIVATKLTMDNRRQLVAYRRRTTKEPGNTFGVTLFFYAIFGGFVSLAMYNIPSFMLSMIVFFTYIMVMVSMTLITDFSSILLDTSDNTIILPRPVDSRTLFAARLTHILLYLGQLAVGLSILPAVLMVVKYGVLLFFAFWVAVGLSILTSVILTNALYLLLMQFANEEKLKSIINYFQIAMAVFIMAGYQVLPRMIERIDMESFVFEIQWWSFLLPPVWMAATIEAIQFKLADGLHIALAASALILPLVGVYLVNKRLSPLFSRKIASLGGGTKETVREKTKSSRLLINLGQWITTNPTERGIFEVIYKILGRDRKIKLKIYPAFGYIAVFGLIFMMRSQEDLATTWAHLPDTQYHLILLYLTFMVLQVALHEIPYSDDFKASWIYYSTPVNKPGEILSGTIKAICARLFFPSYGIISAFVLYVWGYRALDDVLVALINNFLMLMILAMINKRHLPFSMAPDVRTQSGNIVRGIFTFILIGTLGFAHYLLTLLAPHAVILIGIVPVQLIVLFLLFREYKKTRWNQITL